MRGIGQLLLVVMVLLTGCATAAPPTITPLPPPPTETPSGPTPTPAPTATLLPPTPVRLFPGYGPFEKDRPYIVEVSAAQPSQRVFEAVRLSAYTLTFTPANADLDIRLSLLDPDQVPLATVDRGGPGAPETIAEISLPVTGAYEVRIEAVAGAGDVAGEIESLVPELQTGGGMFDPPMEEPDRMASGEFRALDTFHAYTVEMKGGEVVVFELAVESPGLELAFTLYDPDYLPLGTFNTAGAAVARSDDTYIPFDGTYILFVRNLNDGVGTYTLRVVEE